MNANPDLSVSTSLVGGVAVVHVGGDVDLSSERALRTAITDVLSTAPQALILDLTGVDFLGSVGLTIMVETRDQVGPTFAVVAAGPATSKPIEVTNLGDILDVHRTLDEALAALSAP